MALSFRVFSEYYSELLPPDNMCVNSHGSLNHFCPMQYTGSGDGRRSSRCSCSCGRCCSCSCGRRRCQVWSAVVAGYRHIICMATVVRTPRSARTFVQTALTTSALDVVQPDLPSTRNVYVAQYLTHESATHRLASIQSRVGHGLGLSMGCVGLGRSF